MYEYFFPYYFPLYKSSTSYKKAKIVFWRFSPNAKFYKVIENVNGVQINTRKRKKYKTSLTHKFIKNLLNNYFKKKLLFAETVVNLKVVKKKKKRSLRIQ